VTRNSEESFMQARMTHPVAVLPDALTALIGLSKAAESGTVPAATHKLVHLRASQINGCGVCVDMHARELRQLGESDERIAGVAAWRETPYFTDAERAALELTEAATRLADRSDPVPDGVWDDAADHYDAKELAGLVLSIAAINAWNRINATTRQIAGAAWR
jgi:AhpD family alkylhydroperoxidase